MQRYLHAAPPACSASCGVLLRQGFAGGGPLLAWNQSQPPASAMTLEYLDLL